MTRSSTHRLRCADCPALVEKDLRTHALDGVGVGLLAALRPHLTTVIVDRRAA
jgi:hypothetical protein